MPLRNEEQKIDQMQPDYRPCLTCERHPWYPNILPVTLHLNGMCLICKSTPSQTSPQEEDWESLTIPAN